MDDFVLSSRGEQKPLLMQQLIRKPTDFKARGYNKVTMIVVYKRYGKQRDGHWLLNSVLLYHKMQFVQFVLHRRGLSSTHEVCPPHTRFVLHRQCLSSTDFNLFLVLLRLVTHFRLQFDKLPCHLDGRW